MAYIGTTQDNAIGGVNNEIKGSYYQRSGTGKSETVQKIYIAVSGHGYPAVWIILKAEKQEG